MQAGTLWLERVNAGDGELLLLNASPKYDPNRPAQRAPVIHQPHAPLLLAG